MSLPDMCSECVFKTNRRDSHHPCSSCLWGLKIPKQERGVEEIKVEVEEQKIGEIDMVETQKIGLRKCIHGVCFDCGEVCKFCGLDESKYNMMSSSTSCNITTTSLPAQAQIPGKETVKLVKSLTVCERCGKTLQEMTSTEKDKFFMGGYCCQ